MTLPIPSNRYAGIVRPALAQWASVAWGAGATLFLLLFLARRLGPSSLAIFLYVQTIASLFAIVQDGGFQVLLFREQIEPSREIALTAGDLVSGYFGYLALATLLGAAVVLLSPAASKEVFVFAFLYFAFRCVTNLVSSVLKGRGAFEAEALWRIRLNAFLVLPVLLIVGLTAPSPEKVFLGLIIGQVLLLLTKRGREILSRPKLSLPPWRLWKTCLSFVVISGATTVYFKSDIVLLRHLQPDLALVGYYGAAFQILEAVVLFATPIAHLCFRSLRLAWRDGEAFSRLLKRILAGAALAGLAVAGAGLFFAPRIILLAYGKAYGPSAEILPILLLALLFLLPNYVLTQGMIAMNDEKYYAAAASLCAVFNVGLNVLLIPSFLAAGAAWSTVATEVLLAILLGCRFFLRRRGRTGAGLPLKGEEQKEG
jgi:O-antigen/teichoic acid export membrane protein